MARIDGLFHNFANHVTSGLSGFIVAAHDACARAQLQTMVLKLLPELQFPAPLSGDAEFVASSHALRAKFADILGKESHVPLDQISSLVVEVDYAPDEARVQERRRMMAAIPAHYGYDPVFRCTVFMRLSSGQERTVTMEDR
jgi:hypothetical protein